MGLAFPGTTSSAIATISNSYQRTNLGWRHLSPSALNILLGLVSYVLCAHQSGAYQPWLETSSQRNDAGTLFDSKGKYIIPPMLESFFKDGVSVISAMFSKNGVKYFPDDSIDSPEYRATITLEETWNKRWSTISAGKYTSFFQTRWMYKGHLSPGRITSELRSTFQL